MHGNMYLYSVYVQASTCTHTLLHTFPMPLLIQRLLRNISPGFLTRRIVKLTFKVTFN